MESTRRSFLVYGILAALWALAIAWQVQEHARVRQAAESELRTRAHEIANTLSAFIRGLRFRGAVLQDRIVPVLNELVQARTNPVTATSELLSVALLNSAGEPMASAGQPVDLTQQGILQNGEHWGRTSVVLVRPVDLGAQATEGETNRTVVIPSFQHLTNTFRDRENRPERSGERPPDRGEPVPPPPDSGAKPGAPPPPDRGGRRPPWLRGMSQAEFERLIERRSLHGLVLSLSTESVSKTVERDLLLRIFIALLASLATAGGALAWRTLNKTADLQIRLVKASEMNTHLREMNLAAAGLAHETRNPLNIIRGLAQMISRREDATPELRQKSKEIVDEADKVAAQLNEFINYSRPREVRWSSVAVHSILNEVVRALGYDIEEKKVSIGIVGDPIHAQADEQLLRQALFNLLINAIQAVSTGGQIKVTMRREGAEGILEIADTGPGVPVNQRQEIFKPYFTTQKTGTGLGLAVVQQIVLAHGWDIVCLENSPRGALFRISRLKLV